MSSVRTAAVAVFFLAAGCSVILNTAESNQCSTNRDCDANPSLRQRVCEEGFCVVPKAPIVPINDAGQPCVSSALCTQANSNKASFCAKAGGPCTPWQVAPCNFISDGWDAPNAIVIGSIYPFTVKQSGGAPLKLPYAERVRKAIDLALDEFRTEVPGGIVVPGEARRPFAVLHCDSSFDPVQARAAMKHLTDVVGVQAVIVGGDEELLAVSAQALAKRTAVVCSDCVGPFPAGEPAWRIIPPLALQAPMAASRVGSLETEIKAGPNPPLALRVAVLTEPGRAQAAFVAGLIAKLRFNGKTVVENGTNFTLVTSENPLTESVNHFAHADALTTFRPDVVVVAMGSDFPINYMTLIESKWPVDKPKPHYVITDLNYDVTSFSGTLGPSDDGLRRRISGTRNGFEQQLQDNIDGYTLRYQQAYNFARPDGNYSGYDAFYAMAYAIAAASIQLTIDGPHIAAGFGRLRGGATHVNFRPGEIGTGLALLGASTSASIDVRGHWSNLDWNVATRDLATDVSMFCFQRDTDGLLVIKPDAGLRLVTSSGAISGTYSCD
jgi:hypothetical protein